MHPRQAFWLLVFLFGNVSAQANVPDPAWAFVSAAQFMEATAESLSSQATGAFARRKYDDDHSLVALERLRYAASGLADALESRGWPDFESAYGDLKDAYDGCLKFLPRIPGSDELRDLIRDLHDGMRETTRLYGALRVSRPAPRRAPLCPEAVHWAREVEQTALEWQTSLVYLDQTSAPCGDDMREVLLETNRELFLAAREVRRALARHDLFGARNAQRRMAADCGRLQQCQFTTASREAQRCAVMEHALERFRDELDRRH